MKTEEIVKRDLRELKYYYSRKSNMDELIKTTGTAEILSKVQKYNNYILAASAKMYDVYGCLYIQNKTQKSVAMELGYTQEYVRRVQKKLITYFSECIDKNQEA